MWIKMGLNQNSSSTNEKLGDLETDWLGDELRDKLQALVYDILPSNSAGFSYTTEEAL